MFFHFSAALCSPRRDPADGRRCRRHRPDGARPARGPDPTALTEPVLSEAQTLSTGNPPCCGPGPSTLWITIRQTIEVTGETGRGSHLPFPPVSHPGSISRPTCSLSLSLGSICCPEGPGPSRMHRHPHSGGVDKGQGLPGLSAQLPPLGQPMLLGQRKGRGASSPLGVKLQALSGRPPPAPPQAEIPRPLSVA